MATASTGIHRDLVEGLETHHSRLPTGDIEGAPVRASLDSAIVHDRLWAIRVRALGEADAPANVPATAFDAVPPLPADSDPDVTPPAIDGRGSLVLPRPRGFCAGVIRAIDIVRLTLEKLGAPVYVRKEIVHNRHVVEELSAQGAVFVDHVNDAPFDAVMVFSAHGVSPEVREQAALRRMHVIDATCPLVTKVHLEAIRYARNGYSVVLIGHRDHDEVVGTLGEAPETIQVISSAAEVTGLQVPDPLRVAYLTQTTLSVDDTRDVVERLRERFPALVGPSDQDICYATENRQVAVKLIASRVEVVLVVGSKNSSNSNRLVEVAGRAGTRAYLIESVHDIVPDWIDGCTRIGVTAGASTPDHLVGEVIDALRVRGYPQIEEVTFVEESMRFSLPRELRDETPNGEADIAGVPDEQELV
jgi:4-hydroxy-3-methylbut-2-enyl diphosphate reductase